MIRYGLIGYPLGHSFSKKYFSEKFEREGIKGFTYDLFPLGSIAELEVLLKEHPDLRGINVTIPYKKDVLQFLTDRSNLPAGLEACNCIRIDGDELTGFNTDVTGFSRSIEPMLQSQHTNALVLGNGGATAAVKHALGSLGIDYTVVSRSVGNNAHLTYSDLNEEIIAHHKVIINTTPLGTHPDIDSLPDIPYEFITSSHLLYDLVYNPPLTRFLKKGQEHGAAVKNGYDMLVIQAEESWRIWQNISP